jgi:hypothetical protein
MRRLFGIVLAGAIMMLPALSHGTAYAQQAPQKTTFKGELVLWAFEVPGDKTADYEKVLAQLKDSLAKSEKPEAKQQLAGWRVMKNAMAQPGGAFLYIHVINTVPEADYSITNIVYDVVKDPAEQKAFYDLYRGSVTKAVFLLEGPQTADFSK